MNTVYHVMAMQCTIQFQTNFFVADIFITLGELDRFRFDGYFTRGFPSQIFVVGQFVKSRECYVYTEFVFWAVLLSRSSDPILYQPYMCHEPCTTTGHFPSTRHGSSLIFTVIIGYVIGANIACIVAC